MKVAITGKGGVGKTTFASMLSRMFADEGYRVVAVDADLSFSARFSKRSI